MPGSNLPAKLLPVLLLLATVSVRAHAQSGPPVFNVKEIEGTPHTRYSLDAKTDTMNHRFVSFTVEENGFYTTTVVKLDHQDRIFEQWSVLAPHGAKQDSSCFVPHGHDLEVFMTYHSYDQSPVRVRTNGFGVAIIPGVFGVARPRGTTTTTIQGTAIEESSAPPSPTGYIQLTSCRTIPITDATDARFVSYVTGEGNELRTHVMKLAPNLMITDRWIAAAPNDAKQDTSCVMYHHDDLEVFMGYHRRPDPTATWPLEEGWGYSVIPGVVAR